MHHLPVAIRVERGAAVATRVAAFSILSALDFRTWLEERIWDDATLDSVLANPMKVVPGTRMTYAGQSDPAKRKEIIEYIKTLK